MFVTVSSAFLALTLLSTASAAEPMVTQAVTSFKEGTHYATLSRNKSPEKEVIEIFSFNCPACFIYETEIQFPERLKAKLPEGVAFTKYHFTPFGKLGSEFSTAWAIANVLGNQNEVSAAIFEGVHKTRNLRSEADIVKIFEKLGVSAEEYNSLKNDFMVKAFLKKQDDIIKTLPVPALPTFYVNGKYRIELGGIRTNSNNVFAESNINLVNFLLKK